MKNNTIRPISLIITGVGIILVVIAVVFASHHQAPFVPTHPSTTTPTTATTADQNTSASVCYILNKPTTTGGKDIAYLKVTSTDGTDVTGEFGTALDGKDAINGTLTGKATEDSTTQTVIFDGQYNNTGEGMNSVVEQMIKLTPAQAQIGYGELKTTSNGTYSYADPSKVTYSLTLPAVDCTQYDSLKAATGIK